MSSSSSENSQEINLFSDEKLDRSSPNIWPGLDSDSLSAKQNKSNCNGQSRWMSDLSKEDIDILNVLNTAIILFINLFLDSNSHSKMLMYVQADSKRAKILKNRDPVLIYANNKNCDSKNNLAREFLPLKLITDKID
ncbi:hypothetical protein BpHYR1_010113 [Brachionus plicatilis]|uniref:Uncharacterized protein n=1 Tax=Brachionus plicatilis TaxID=10195 RepID=A0A3M7PRF9_BRAPC|nr:hypothetical protein BpHYR1_010113 [Brachionus plicatilis]